mgnify:CR=1 FL=1
MKEFPETWTEFLDAIKKLKASGVIPIAMGTQTTYMAGHLHDQIFYKWLGTDAAKKLGSRDMKWTDPEVVETLQFVQDLIDAGAFDKNAAGMTDNIAMTQFQQGEAAMVITVHGISELLKIRQRHRYVTALKLQNSHTLKKNRSLRMKICRHCLRI